MIFAIRTDCFFLLGINFRNFHKVTSTHAALTDFFVFIEYMQKKYSVH